MLMRLLREQRGSALVMVAAGMVFLLLMAGLVIDVGHLYLQKTIAQNGVDAAALAGATALPDQAVATNRAEHYADLNLEGGTLAAPDFSKGPGRIDLTYSKIVPTFLMKIANYFYEGSYDKVTVRVAAAAKLRYGGGPFAYTIFSGSDFDMLPLNGSRLYVDGSVHSDADLRINGSDITVTGAAEAHGIVRVNGSQLNIPTQISNAARITMPDFSQQISDQAAAANHVFNGNKTYNGGQISVDGSIHVNGSVTLNGNTISGTGAILASGGDININGNIINNSAGDQVCLYSQTGSIHINGNNITVNGIIYAPNGDIHINGSNITVNGRIIGNTVKINGSNFRVNGQNVEVTSLPPTGSVLIE